MAIYHCSTKPISRAKGRSATASSAYRSASKIYDDRTGEIHDYTKKQGVAHTQIITPKSIDSESINRDKLWNMAEKAENRKDARVAREFVIALPHELDEEKRKKVAKEFTQYLADRYNVVADLAIHKPDKNGDNKNHHAHILITTREIKVDEKSKSLIFSDKSKLELSNNKRKSLKLGTTQNEIKEIREKWADIANAELKRSGIKERIDHRSYKDQNIDLIPTKHEGPIVTEARRNGKIIGVAKLNDEIKEENKIIKSIKIEEQQNRKPSFFEKIGLKKVEKIEEDLPPISEIIKSIDDEIKEVKMLESKLIIELAEIRKKEMARESFEQFRRSRKDQSRKDLNKNKDFDIWENLREKYGLDKNLEKAANVKNVITEKKVEEEIKKVERVEEPTVKETYRERQERLSLSDDFDFDR